jgi:hypothetical protein
MIPISIPSQNNLDPNRKKEKKKDSRARIKSIQRREELGHLKNGFPSIIRKDAIQVVLSFAVARE